MLAHWEHSFLDDTLKIIDECPFGVCEVEFRALVWAPQVGQRLCEWTMPLNPFCRVGAGAALL